MTNVVWWEIPALTGALALGGVLLGQAVLVRNEMWKGKREDNRRWHQERLKLYNEILNEYEDLRHQVHAFANGKTTEPLTIDTTSALDRLSRRTTLISTQEVADAASGLWTAIFVCIGEMNDALDTWYDDLEDEDRAAFRAAVVNKAEYEVDAVKGVHEENTGPCAEALLIFVARVRAELGVPGNTGPNPRTRLGRRAMKRRLRSLGLQASGHPSQNDPDRRPVLLRSGSGDPD